MNLAAEKKGAFRKMMKDVERSIAEANELAKVMNKRIRFKQYLVGLMPESYKNTSVSGGTFKNPKD